MSPGLKVRFKGSVVYAFDKKTDRDFWVREFKRQMRSLGLTQADLHVQRVMTTKGRKHLQLKLVRGGK